MIYNGSSIVIPIKPDNWHYTSWIVGREKGRYYFPETNGCILTNRPGKVITETSNFFGSVPGAYSASGTYNIGSPIAGYVMAWDAGGVSGTLYKYGFDLSSGDAYAFPKDEYSRVYNPDTNVQEYNFYYRNGSNSATSSNNLWAGTLTKDSVKVPTIVMQGKLTNCSYYAFIIAHAATGGVKQVKFVNMNNNNAKYTMSLLHTTSSNLLVYRWRSTFNGTNQTLYFSHPIIRFNNSYTAATKPYQYDIFRIYIMATVEIAS